MYIPRFVQPSNFTLVIICRFILAHSCELRCWLQDNRFKHYHGCHCDGCLGASHKAPVLHTCVHPCINHSVSSSRIDQCAGSLLPVESRQDGLPHMHGIIPWCSIRISGDWSFSCSTDPSFDLKFTTVFFFSFWFIRSMLKFHFLHACLCNSDLVELFLQLLVSFAKIIIQSIWPQVEILGRLQGTEIFCNVKQYPVVHETPTVLTVRIETSFLCFVNSSSIKEKYRH